MIVRNATGRLSRRTFSSSARQHVQRLLWAGSVLDQQSNKLKEVPKDWFLAMGMHSDIEQGISFNTLAASSSHTLVAYTTLAPTLPVAQHVLSNQGHEPPRTTPAGLHRIAAIGRNTYGELGAGFASQESTWGMVRGTFEGAGGVKAIQCGLGTSWLVTRTRKGPDAPTKLYSFGNHTSGQLGLGGEEMPYAISEGGEPQMKLFSVPKEVQFDGVEEAQVQEIVKIESGLDHTIILVKSQDGKQSVYSCGINTDGQLGSRSHRICSTSFTKVDLSAAGVPASDQDPIVGISAGGDTSVLWTQSGRLWGWGNSEYGQALVGAEAIDRIDVPTEASEDLAKSIEGKVIDVRFGGSFVIVLDDRGNVYSAGYGAIGQGKEHLLSLKPRKILSGASMISTGIEQASAVLHDSQGSRTKLAVWGLDSAAGRLAIGTRKPYPSYMLASRFTPEEIELRTYQPVLANGLKDEWIGGQDGSGVLKVVHGREAMFVLVEDGRDEIGRWEPSELP